MELIVILFICLAVVLALWARNNESKSDTPEYTTIRIKYDEYDAYRFRYPWLATLVAGDGKIDYDFIDGAWCKDENSTSKVVSGELIADLPVGSYFAYGQVDWEEENTNNWARVTKNGYTAVDKNETKRVLLGT